MQLKKAEDFFSMKKDLLTSARLAADRAYLNTKLAAAQTRLAVAVEKLANSTAETAAKCEEDVIAARECYAVYMDKMANMAMGMAASAGSSPTAGVVTNADQGGMGGRQGPADSQAPTEGDRRLFEHVVPPELLEDVERQHNLRRAIAPSAALIGALGPTAAGAGIGALTHGRKGAWTGGGAGLGFTLGTGLGARDPNDVGGAALGGLVGALGGGALGHYIAGDDKKKEKVAWASCVGRRAGMSKEAFGWDTITGGISSLGEGLQSAGQGVANFGKGVAGFGQQAAALPGQAKQWMQDKQTQAQQLPGQVADAATQGVQQAGNAVQSRAQQAGQSAMSGLRGVGNSIASTAMAPARWAGDKLQQWGGNISGAAQQASTPFGQ